MMKRSRFIIVTSVLVLLSACSGPNDDDDDLSTLMPDQQTAAATRLTSGSDWVLEELPNEACFRLRIGDRSTECTSTTYAGSVAWGTWRLPDDRQVRWIVFGGQADATARLFTSGSDATNVSSVAVGSESSLFTIEVASGEQAWGLQVFAADGTFLGAYSLLD